MPTILQRVETYIADESQITLEQREAIRSPARLTIVRACPGSGKTRAFAARFAWDVANVSSARCGVAALSFTNVAQEEVRTRVRALDIPDGHPHFVGTIDSFLLRYVVRRFGGGLVNLDRFSHPVSDRDYSIQGDSFQYGDGKQFDRLSSFRIGLDENGKVRVEHLSKDYKLVAAPELYKTGVIDAKKAAWQIGELTYSDVVAIAWWLLRKKAIAKIVAGRFPHILVDEFQDTSGMREHCLRLLFESSRFERGFVVGDPDQCIMEFAGARAELFKDFEEMDGAKTFEFTSCFRFHPRIAAVTVALRSSTAIAVDGRRAVTDRAETVLLTHPFTVQPKDGSVAAITAKFAEVCCERKIAAEEGIVLTWNDADVQRLSGLQKKRLPLTALAVSHVMGAIRSRAAGKMLDAFLRIERLLAQLTFGVARPPRQLELQTRGLELRRWRATVMRVLDETVRRVEGESVEGWGSRVRNSFEAAVKYVTGQTEKLGHKFRMQVDGKKKVLTAAVSEYLPEPSDIATSGVSNIHQVKGQEFPAVCVYVPADRKGTPLADPILMSAPQAPDSQSARRILYVGATRAHDLLVFAIPAAWLPALENSERGKAFLQAFDRKITL